MHFITIFKCKKKLPFTDRFTMRIGWYNFSIIFRQICLEYNLDHFRKKKSLDIWLYHFCATIFENSPKINESSLHRKEPTFSGTPISKLIINILWIMQTLMSFSYFFLITKWFQLKSK